MDSEVKYGYITGSFDIDTEQDVIWEFERINEDSSISYFIGIETIREVNKDNVILFASSIDFTKWLNEFQPPII